MRHAFFTDTPEIKSLWKESFGDTNVFINRFIAHFGVENCYVSEINGEWAAMAFAIPVVLSFVNEPNKTPQHLPFRYLYACATRKRYQKRGIMAKLIEEIYNIACKENSAGIFLRPANDYLAKYYKKLGLECFFYRNQFLYNKDQLLLNIANNETLNSDSSPSLSLKKYNNISPEIYLQKRISKVENECFINWDETFFRFINQCGIHFCEYEDTVFSYKIEFSQIIVEEILGNAPHEEIARIILEQHSDIKAVQIFMLGTEHCCGQIKWCNQESKPTSQKPHTQGYFAFGMD